MERQESISKPETAAPPEGAVVVDVPRLVVPLPCPFCGVEPLAYVDDNCGAPYPGGYFTIECENEDCAVNSCLSEKRRTYLQGMTHDEAEAAIWPEIIAKWNIRQNK